MFPGFCGFFNMGVRGFDGRRQPHHLPPERRSVDQGVVPGGCWMGQEELQPGGSGADATELRDSDDPFQTNGGKEKGGKR